MDIKRIAGTSVAVLATIGLSPGVSTAFAGEIANHRAIGDTTVFASVPAPGTRSASRSTSA